LFKRTCRFAGIQFTKHFMEFVLVETNRLVGSNRHVILTRQTCGQRSSRVAGSKRRALAFHFSVRIWYFILILQCRGESDLGLCMTSVIAKRMQLRSANFQRILQPNTFLNRKSALCGRADLTWFVFHLLAFIGIGENYAVQSLAFGLHCPLKPITLVTFETRILNEATATLPTLYSLLWPLPPLFTSNSGNVSPPPGC